MPFWRILMTAGKAGCNRTRIPERKALPEVMQGTNLIMIKHEYNTG